MILDPKDTTVDLQYCKTEDFKKNLYKMNEVLKVLEVFSDNFDKKFNISKLTQYFKLTPHEIDEIIILILHFQKLFKTVFKDHVLKRSIINNQSFIVLEKELNNIPLPQDIFITSLEKKIFSDIIYTFKHLKRGKVFDLNEPNTKLLKNLKQLREYYPYFFRQNGKNLIYPSEVGLKLGDLILSYNKTSIKFLELKLEYSRVIFKEDVWIKNK